MVGRISLGRRNTVGIMTGGTGDPVVDVPAVRGEALVTQEAVATVTVVAEGIGKLAFGGKVVSTVVVLEQGRVHGSMRPFYSGTATGTVAVGAVNETGHGHGCQQTGNVPIGPLRNDRVE